MVAESKVGQRSLLTRRETSQILLLHRRLSSAKTAPAMKTLFVYARLYVECLRKAAAGIRKNPWTLLLPIVLLPAFFIIGALLWPLGFVGGILMVFVRAALISCYLYFTGEVVSQSRVRISEFGRSIGTYLWSVVNLYFVLWIATFLLNLALRTNPRIAYLSEQLFSLASLILLNPAPEIIYLRGTYGGMATVQRSVAFVQQNWIEWFAPNLPLAALAYLVRDILYPAYTLTPLIAAIPIGALFQLAMVFRGHLFLALDGSTHRQRMFRYRSPT